jgi:hypothetical protein
MARRVRQGRGVNRRGALGMGATICRTFLDTTGRTGGLTGGTDTADSREDTPSQEPS